MDKMNLKDTAGVSVIRGTPSELTLKGRYRVQHVRDGRVLADFEGNNGITNVGKNALLDIMFHATTQVTTWYIGLVDNSGFSAFAAGDTMSSHSGWTESTAYSESTRNDWNEDAASGQSTTNSTAITFTMNATATIKGIFVASNSTKGGTTGTLWSTAAFGSTVSVNSGDLLKVTYTVSA